MVTSRAPAAAPAATTNVAVISVELSTFSFVVDTPEPLTVIAASGSKFDPVRVTSTLLPAGALAGEIHIRTGIGGAGGNGALIPACGCHPGFSPAPAYAPRKTAAPFALTLDAPLKSCV